MYGILKSKIMIVPAVALTILSSGCGGDNKAPASSGAQAQKQEVQKQDTQKKEAGDAVKKDQAALKKFIESAKPVIGVLAAQNGILSSLNLDNLQSEELVNVTNGIMKNISPAEATLNSLETPEAAKDFKGLLTQDFAAFNELNELAKKAFSDGNALDKAKFLLSVKDIISKHEGLFKNITASVKEAGLEGILSAALSSGQFPDISALLSKFGLPGTVSASSGKMNNGSIALISDAAKKFLINDTKNGQTATVDFSKELLNLSASGDGHYVQKFMLNILNGSRNKDENAGTWDGTTHSVPIQAEYDVKNGNVIPGMLKTKGKSGDQYNEYLYDQSSVDTVNLLLEGMASLANSAKQ